MSRFVGIAIVVAFTAMFNTVHHVEAGAVAGPGVCRALFAALSATAELIIGAFCTV